MVRHEKKDRVRSPRFYSSEESNLLQLAYSVGRLTAAVTEDCDLNIERYDTTPRRRSCQLSQTSFICPLMLDDCGQQRRCDRRWPPWGYFRAVFTQRYSPKVPVHDVIIEALVLVFTILWVTQEWWKDWCRYMNCRAIAYSRPLPQYHLHSIDTWPTIPSSDM